MYQPRPCPDDANMPPMDLEDVLTAEIDVCTPLLEAAAETREALSDQHADRLARCMRSRADGMKKLAELEKRAEALRPGRGGVLLPGAQTKRTQLAQLVDRIRDEEAVLQRLSHTTVGNMRERLQELRTGKDTLRGYRGAPAVEPRFADRRG